VCDEPGNSMIDASISFHTAGLGSTKIIPTSMSIASTFVPIIIALVMLAAILCSTFGCFLFIYIKRRYW
jgi:hypothetical protein